jgi:hypothetical protein
VDGSGGKGIIIGPAASRAELDAARDRLRTDPRGWIAQPVVQLSTVPTLAGEVLRPRHVDLRPFAVNDGENVWVLPGGLTRVALAEGQLVVNSSQGGGSKDTWVLGPARPTQREVERTRAGTPRMPGARVPHDDAPPEPGRSQQQEQQQQEPLRVGGGAAAPPVPTAPGRGERMC